MSDSALVLQRRAVYSGHTVLQDNVLKSREPHRAPSGPRHCTDKIMGKPISSSEEKKSSFSKKKKIKKYISTGIAYVKSTFNNTIISIADTHGNVIAWSSAGKKGFKGSRKSTPYAAQIAADAAAAYVRL